MSQTCCVKNSKHSFVSILRTGTCPAIVNTANLNNMKFIYIVTTLVALTSFCAFGQARLGVNPWSVTFKVVDEAGQPVAGAIVQVGYLQNERIVGQTDNHGAFSASHADKSIALGFLVGKENYYSDYLHYELFSPGQFDDSIVATNRNFTQVIVLRKIGKPIPMYAKQESAKFLKENVRMGFDLISGDWAAPFGKGSHSDIFFNLHREIVNEYEYSAALTVDFPNKGDGIAVAPMESDTGGDFKTSRTAVESGYEPNRTWHYSHAEHPAAVFGYFMRIRTVLDENGNVKSALYGKIRGDFRFYAGTRMPHAGVGFDYYLNPTPNDRNLEFNPSRNLIKNLSITERVRTP
jgi:hypothetical protein